GTSPLTTNMLAALLSKYTGTNVSLLDLAKAASDVQTEARKAGDPSVTVAIAREQITNGIVTMNLYHGSVVGILVSGRVYTNLNDNPSAAVALTRPGATTPTTPSGTNTNAGPSFVVRAYEVRGDTLLPDATMLAIFKKYTG